MYFLGRSNQFLTDLLEETEILKMTSKQIASKFRRSVQKQIKRQQTLQTRVCWQKYSSQKHLFDTWKNSFVFLARQLPPTATMALERHKQRLIKWKLRCETLI